MDRRNYKSKPQHLVTDPRSREIKRIVHPSDTDIGSPLINADLRVFGDIKGTLQQTVDGLSYLVAGSNVTIVTASNGQITITSTGGGGSSSGSFTGSLTKLLNGTSYIVAGANITVTTGSLGQVTIAGTGGGGGSGADPGASYIVIANTASLANERALTAGTGLLLVDAGANSTITFKVNDGIVATLTGSNFSGPVLATGGLSGSLQMTTTGLSYLVASGSISIITGSNGQVTVGTIIPSHQVDMVSTVAQAGYPGNVFLRVGGSSVDTSMWPTTIGKLTRAIQFQADIQKTSGVTSAEVQLVDITNNVTITGTDLTTTGGSTTTARMSSGNLTVGSASGNIRNDQTAQYEVQLKMNGGSSNDQVFCTSARLIISYS